MTNQDPAQPDEHQAAEQERLERASEGDYGDPKAEHSATTEPEPTDDGGSGPEAPEA